jgi:flagellar hook-basal body complex protein FliE
VVNPVSIPGLVAPPDAARVAPAAQPAGQPAGSGFMKLLDGLLQQVNSSQGVADQAVRDLATGRTDNLHGVLLSVAKADLSFRLFLEIRNRLTDALQEIMRMQV